ncbi:CopG family transcriptional regulator [uncultured Ruminococcus sp.]|uniref:CopG family transcriptional regulator n=1 Tax=uncultured Ruminococcus sp. TaxID=165186 RepID=UPI0025E2475A|nr:CopG family transcriptional regulator [uncultured Ruminococcus sp.]
MSREDVIKISENGRKKMGRPTLDKRDKRFELRLSEETYSTLEECAETLGITKAEVIHKGISLVKADIEKSK